MNCALKVKENMSVHNAVNDGNLMALKRLLDRLKDVNERDSKMSTPLHFAIWNVFLEISLWLILRGADLEAKQIHGLTALQVACLSDRENCARLSLYKGADVNSTEKHRKTPVHFACQRDNLLVARCLFTEGARL